MQRMRMAYGHHLGPRLVHGGVQQQPNRIDHAAAAHHLAAMVDLHELGCLDPLHGDAHWVHPEVVGQLGIAQGHVSEQALGEAASGEDAAGGRKTLQRIAALFVLGLESWASSRGATSSCR